MVCKGNHPQMAELFRLVKYCNSPIYIYTYIYIYIKLYIYMCILNYIYIQKIYVL
jgi:hypothetical protein